MARATRASAKGASASPQKSSQDQSSPKAAGTKRKASTTSSPQAKRGKKEQKTLEQTVGGVDDDKHEKMGEKVTSLDDETARKHFRVAVIRPQIVEELNLNPDKAGRKVYTFKPESGDWDMVETWP